MLSKIIEFFKRKQEASKPHCLCSDPQVDKSLQPLQSADGATYKLTISEGCMVCGACEASCPLVFEVTENGVVFRAGYENYLAQELENIKEAIHGCPCEILSIEHRHLVQPGDR